MNITQTLLDGVSVNGAGNPMFIADFASLNFDVLTTGNTTAVIKFVVSDEETVDFNSPSVSGNQWNYLHTIDLSDGTGIAGGTGLVLTGTDFDKTMEGQFSGAKWIGVIVSGYVAGVINVKATAFSKTQ